MQHSSKNGCSEQDEVFNPYLKAWVCVHCGETLSNVDDSTKKGEP